MHLYCIVRCGHILQNKIRERGIIFYSGREEEDLVNVIRDAERSQKEMVLEKNVIDLEEENGSGSSRKVTKAFSRR